MDIKDILSLQLNFFKEPKLRDEIAKKAQVVDVEHGYHILNEGRYVKTVPILLNGLVKVVRKEAGKELLLYYIYPLESCIVSIHCGINQIKSRVEATAEEDSRALLLPSHLVGEWRTKYQSFNDFILGTYQKRFDDVLDAFNALAFHSLDDRLLAYLKAKANALGKSKIEMTHQDLGDELGTARETVSRMLKKLEVEEKVKLHRGWIEIL
ncbi:MAG: Crp/Fnr family transcriptional regulator [Cyclobacteriaceae bacterium]